MNTATVRTFCVYEKIFKQNIKNPLGVQRCAEGIFTVRGAIGCFAAFGEAARTHIPYDIIKLQKEKDNLPTVQHFANLDFTLTKNRDIIIVGNSLNYYERR